MGNVNCIPSRSFQREADHRREAAPARRCRRNLVDRNRAVAHNANEMQEMRQGRQQEVVVIDDGSDLDMDESPDDAGQHSKENLTDTDDVHQEASARQRRASSVFYDAQDDWGAWDDFGMEVLAGIDAQQQDQDILLAIQEQNRANVVARDEALRPAVIDHERLRQSPARKPNRTIWDLTREDNEVVSMLDLEIKSEVESRANCVERVAEVFPDICREHVSELYDKAAVKHRKQSNVIIERILDQGSPYPSAMERTKVLKRKRVVDPDEEAANLYGAKNRNLAQVDHDYRKHV